MAGSRNPTVSGVSVPTSGGSSDYPSATWPTEADARIPLQGRPGCRGIKVSFEWRRLALHVRQQGASKVSGVVVGGHQADCYNLLFILYTCERPRKGILVAAREEGSRVSYKGSPA